MRVPFVKMEGLGNDYLFVDAIAGEFPRHRAAELARRWSDRHFGVGADGLILLARGRSTLLAMAMWNADGSEGAMCGNGLRCLARFAREQGHVAVDEFAVETAAGIRRVQLRRRADGTLGDVAADLGRATVAAAPERIDLGGTAVLCWRGSAGNPHAVVFVDGDPEAVDVAGIGGALQRHATFPGGVNVEFVQVVDAGSLRQRTFERGSGETLACGTGAAVAALCAVRTGRVAGPEVRVLLRGGELIVRCAADGTLVIVGPARTVFRGEIELVGPQ